MKYSVYIRPLQLKDALTSYQWRNNPRLWLHTGSKPTQPISPEMETAWLGQVLQRENEKRFAICLKQNERYIGNIYLTGITDLEAEIHIFIGDLEYWGKKKAYEAICLIMKYSFEELGLNLVYAVMKDSNRSTDALAKSFYGSQTETYYDERRKATFYKWILTRQVYESKLKSELEV